MYCNETRINFRLSAALNNTGFADALENLGLSSGAGSDGNLPARLVRNVDSRQEDGQGCRELETEWKNFNTSADQAVPGLEGELDASQTDLAISSLNNLNNRLERF